MPYGANINVGNSLLSQALFTLYDEKKRREEEERQRQASLQSALLGNQLDAKRQAEQNKFTAGQNALDREAELRRQQQQDLTSQQNTIRSNMTATNQKLTDIGVQNQTRFNEDKQAETLASQFSIPGIESVPSGQKLAYVKTFLNEQSPVKPEEPQVEKTLGDAYSLDRSISDALIDITRRYNGQNKQDIMNELLAAGDVNQDNYYTRLWRRLEQVNPDKFDELWDYYHELLSYAQRLKQ